MPKLLTSILSISILFLIGLEQVDAQQYDIKRFTFGAGGVVNATTPANTKMSGIVGQFAIERRSYAGSNYVLEQGFWVPGPYLTDVEEPPVTVLSENLMNFPNPFSTSTTIKYSLPGTSYVTLKIYDMMGHEIKTLLNGVYQEGGNQEIQWNAKNEYGIDVGSGSYLYELNVQPAQMAGAPTFVGFTLRNVMVIIK